MLLALSFVFLRPDEFRDLRRGYEAISAYFSPFNTSGAMGVTCIVYEFYKGTSLSSRVLCFIFVCSDFT